MSEKEEKLICLIGYMKCPKKRSSKAGVNER